MHTEPWPRDAVFRVRIGIHSGLGLSAQRRRCRRGPSPGRASCVGGTRRPGHRVGGHGRSGHAVVRDGLVSLGRFRLRDFDEPVQLYQAPGTGSLEEFPSVRAVPADGHNLVRPSTSFIGRDDAIAGLGGLIGPRRVVTVVGPGGVGKTRLVIELGLGLASQWRDGVWFVDLSIVADSRLCVGAVANAIGCPTSGNADLRDTVVDWLRTRQALSDPRQLRASPRCNSSAHCRCPGHLSRGGCSRYEPSTTRPRGEHLWRLDPLGHERRRS